MGTYRLPASLAGDITKFSTLARGYVGGSVTGTEFKALRVPLGVYEQRRDNVYMARVRATGGVITASQLLAVIDIARRHASDLLHLTTRQEVQVQNLSLEEVEPVLRELQAVGLATKGGGGNTVRNIMVSELSGIGQQETFDTTPYAMELTSLMVAEPDSYLLPRKMKIAFSSDEHNVDYAAINDVGLVAQVRDGKRGFRVYVGGGAGARPTTGWLLFDFMPAENLYALVKGLKNFFSAHGNRKDRNKARIRFIFYKLGAEETLRLIRQYYEEEVGRGVVLRPQEEPSALAALAVEEGEAGAVPTDAYYETWGRRYVTQQRQAGYVSVVLPVRLGNIFLGDPRAEALVEVLKWVRSFGELTVRFTNTQNIRLRNLPKQALPQLYNLLTPLHEEITAPVVVNNIVSCTGADTCRLGVALSKGLAAAIGKALLGSTLDLDRLADVSIHVTGCPNSCGQQLWADLGFAGRTLRNDRSYPGYQVFLAANRRDNPRLAEAVGTLSARDVPAFVVRLLGEYLSLHDGRSLNAYLQAEGRDAAQRLLDEYKEVPSFEDDKNYYFDWGAQELYTVVPRGKAECSAGLYDMIQVDIDTIASNRKALQGETDLLKRSQLVQSTVYAAARMLLVTRGLDPRSNEELFDQFIDQFISPGYVDARFKALVLKARGQAEADFSADEDEAFALADAVTELYEGMDDSLQFKRPTVAQTDTPAQPTRTEGLDKVFPFTQSTTSAEPVSTSNTVDRSKDLRGVLCPMNFVKTKMELAAMASGQLLEILLDDGQPIDNVPGSVRGEGHTIVREEPVNNYWRVIIRKK